MHTVCATVELANNVRSSSRGSGDCEVMRVEVVVRNLYCEDSEMKKILRDGDGWPISILEVERKI
jgi:hypothetical protein